MIFLEHRGTRVEVSAKKNFSKNLFWFQKSYEEKEILKICTANSLGVFSGFTVHTDYFAFFYKHRYLDLRASF